MEILIEHYRLGMKLSLPIQIKEKVLLDSGARIESERILEKVKDSGVKRLDVDRSYLGELSKNYPEFYSFKQGQVENARSSGRQKRIDSANFLIQVRRVVSQQPLVTICCHSDKREDFKDALEVFFKVETCTHSLSEALSGLTRSSLIVIDTRDFMSNHIATFKQDIRKLDSKIKILGVHHGGPPPRNLHASLDIQEGYEHLLKTSFFSVYSDKFSELGSPKIPGAKLPMLNRPVLQLFVENSLRSEYKTLFEGLDISVEIEAQTPEELDLLPLAKVMVLRIENKEGELVELLRRMMNQGAKLEKIVSVVSTLSKQEIEPIRKLGLTHIVLGDLGQEKIIKKLEGFCR